LRTRKLPRRFEPCEHILYGLARRRASLSVMAGNCDLILCAFLHFTDELPAFGCEVIRLLREERVGAAVTQDSAARAKILA
jgi:hypothetical protein